MNDFERKDSHAARAAWLYYQEDMTQGDIARELGVSRSTVVRLLQRAKSEGLVQISLNVSAATFEAERNLERAFGIRTARIVPASRDDATQKRWFGHVAAEMLTDMVKDDAVVAVSWGTTLQALADALTVPSTAAGVEIVTLVGGLHNASRGANTFEVAKQFGQHFNASVRALHAPVYVQEEATALALAVDPGIQEGLAIARNASIVVFSIGSMCADTTMFQLGYIAPDQQEFLRRRGAVADIACRWIDSDGKPVELPSTINPVAITLEELREIPLRLAVAGGASKQEAILAGLRGGFVTHLVTDEQTASYLLASRTGASSDSARTRKRAGGERVS